MMPRGRSWTPEEDAILAVMVREGVEYEVIAEELNRTNVACRLRASWAGLRQSTESILANRQRGRERFYSDKRKVRARRKKLLARFTKTERQNLSAEARARNLAGTFGVRQHRPETIEKIRQAHLGRKFTDEHRAKIAEGRRRYWEQWRAAKKAAIVSYALVMRQGVSTLDREALVTAETIWCGQCERQVRQNEAAVCASQFCKAKALAA